MSATMTMLREYLAMPVPLWQAYAMVAFSSFMVGIWNEAGSSHRRR